MSTELLAVAHLNTDEADECLVGMLHEELLVHLQHLAATAHLYKYSSIMYLHADILVHV